MTAGGGAGGLGVGEEESYWRMAGCEKILVLNYL